MQVMQARSLPRNVRVLLVLCLILCLTERPVAQPAPGFLLEGASLTGGGDNALNLPVNPEPAGFQTPQQAQNRSTMLAANGSNKSSGLGIKESETRIKGKVISTNIEAILLPDADESIVEQAKPASPPSTPPCAEATHVAPANPATLPGVPEAIRIAVFNAACKSVLGPFYPYAEEPVDMYPTVTLNPPVVDPCPPRMIVVGFAAPEVQGNGVTPCPDENAHTLLAYCHHWKMPSF